MNEEKIRKEIFNLVKEFYEVKHKPKKFIPGKSRVNYAGRFFDEREIISLVDSALDFWLTAGRFEKDFKEKLAKFLGVKHVITVNSGSSANLLAISALTSPKLGNKMLKEGDEIITTAATFPTTIAPIVQNRFIPVFIDIELGNYNADIKLVEEAISEKTKAIFLAHTLGIPFEIDKMVDLCKKHNLFLIEDNCDALGSKYKDKYTGKFGDISTLSFYPAHHITTGEGGAVITNNDELKKIIQSFRDWGRDCWCEPGQDNTCGKRFSQQFATMPFGYDHKYIFSHLGYNLKMTDMQAAIGVAQLEKLLHFKKRRKENFEKLNTIFKEYEDFFVLPKTPKQADPSPFGFVLTVKDKTPFSRKEIVDYLEKNLIQTRMLFAGNITRQPCMEGIKSRLGSELKNTDKIMNDTFWLGVYPGMTEDMIQYISKKIKDFFKKR
jgi:CDP-6-deoxy-D-xylo-4-hexulose-3-dehydrase